MAEVLVEFTDVIVGDDDHRYRARACGAPMAGDERWEGWIEFLPIDEGAPVRSPRETTQPNREAAIYWATGLTGIYAEGALRRALSPRTPRVPDPVVKPIFDTPAPEPTVPSAVVEPLPDAVLDPFSVYEKGESLLRKELSALSAWHLVNILLAYNLTAEPATALNRLPGATLTEMIISRVRERVPARR